MTTRIPSSLKWLIDKRARLDAEVQKTRASLAKAKKLIKELSEIEKDLKGIDQVLELHKISVDTSLISPVKSHYNRVNLPHGELTRSILMCLRQSEDNQPVSKQEIVQFIKSRHPELIDELEVRAWLLTSVRYRLKCLYREGVIQRHHAPQSKGKEGLWSLTPEENCKAS